MNFYLMMARKYANIRTFKPEDGAGTGGATKTAEELAAEEAAAAAEKAADANKGKSDAEARLAEIEAEKAALAAELEEARAEKARLLAESMSRKEKLKAYEGVDPEKYRKLVAEQEAADLKAAEAAGDFERVKQMMADAHKAEMEARDARIAELEGLVQANAGTIDKLSIGNAFGTSSFIADKMILTPAKTRVLYGDHFEVEDGQVVAYDKPKGDKDRTKLVDSLGRPLPFDVALEKIVDADPDKKTVLRARAKSGAGSGTEVSGDPKTVTTEKPRLFGREAIAAALAAEVARKAKA